MIVQISKYINLLFYILVVVVDFNKHIILDTARHILRNQEGLLIVVEEEPALQVVSIIKSILTLSLYQYNLYNEIVKV